MPDGVFEGAPDIAVVFAGRFQPFHRGHFAAYRWLCGRFGEASVWLASSDRTGPGDGYNRPAPLSFAEKRRVATTLFPVPPERMVCVKSPYRPIEILGTLPAEQTAFVAAVGARDADRLRSRYWAPFRDGEPLLPCRERGYVLVLPSFEGDVSASAIREIFADPALEPVAREAAFRALYPRFDVGVFAMLNERLGAYP